MTTVEKRELINANDADHVPAKMCYEEYMWNVREGEDCKEEFAEYLIEWDTKFGKTVKESDIPKKMNMTEYSATIEGGEPHYDQYVSYCHEYDLKYTR